MLEIITVAKLMGFDYIASFYNTRRRHSSLGVLPSAQFEEHRPASPRNECVGGRRTSKAPGVLSRRTIDLVIQSFAEN